MLITKEWLQKYKTKSGGYTKAQINALGMEWPPRKGWEKDIVGLDITELDARIFEKASGAIGSISLASDYCIWTDGACIPNPGKGGWGWVDSLGNEDCGGERYTTNNRMEMMAIHQALIRLPDEQEVTLFSDSQYCINGLTVWRNGWKKKNWKKHGEPMINRDLWLGLEDQVLRLSVKFIWVRGHDGNEGNERADKLSLMGIGKY